ncbi:hypothetical protein MMC16_001130 [Acarospora aff. strigata]|nr:hypothetical protein [Acarospora aff. strigata]
MISTALRSTPNLTVPSSQNTAPVLEFRCLYSHDLRRKSKRWQDGFLRFHTFNKRVMVYDVPRNFIGDMHWREDGTVQDGDELQLEKGVLVQVGESVGSMDQDLTGLFEKRRVPHESPLAKKVEASPSSFSTPGDNATTPLTQLRPKSLNALLGTPRGRYGRAILPTLSPFEQRHEIGNYELGKSACAEEGRSAKRQKPNPPSSIAVPQQSPSLPRAKSSRQKMISTATDSSGPAKAWQNNKDPEIIEIHSGPEGAEHSPDEERPTTKSRGVRAAQRIPTSSLLCASPPVSTTNHLPPVNPVNRKSPAPPESSAASAVQPAATRSTEPEDSAPVNPLRPASRKPRKKLMYKELLPPKRPPSRNQPDAALPRTSTAHGKTQKEPPTSPSPPDELSTFQKAQRKRLGARMGRQTRYHDLTSPESSQLTHGDDLFRLRDEFEDRADVVPIPSPPPPPSVSRVLQPKQPPDSGPIRRLANNITVPTNASNNPAPKLTPNHDRRRPLPASTSTTAITASTIPIPPPTNHQPLAPPAPSLHSISLHRSNSAPNPNPNSTIPPPLQPQQQSQQPSLPLNPIKPKPKSPLRKWTSLPAKPPPPPPPLPPFTGVAAQTLQTAKEAQTERDEDTGPWSREAFDLFEWRPPDRIISPS